MTHEEFFSRIAEGIRAERSEGVLVDVSSIRLLGDEDGDVCFSYQWTTELAKRQFNGYYYFTLGELANMVCDD